MTKFKDKYRVESTRLPEWDYAAAGWYFVTICVKDRQHVFGHVHDGEMQLSALGNIAHQFLADIPIHFPLTEIDVFVVMPNHVHAIVVIHDNIETPRVETPRVASLRQPKRKFGPLQPGSLSKIIQAYKAVVTRQARNNCNADFAWQERFYDHIIRDDRSLENIRVYIIGNPIKWEEDEYFSGM
jgi:REP element-mobilizing transposase RayT